MKKLLAVMLLLSIAFAAQAEDGYRLWLRYNKIGDASLLANYKKQLGKVYFAGDSETIRAAKDEWKLAAAGLLTQSANFTSAEKAQLIAGNAAQLSALDLSINTADLQKAGEEGFIIFNTPAQNKIIITAKSDVGVLYGLYHFLRLMQTQQPLQKLNIVSTPAIKLRLLNHWDNLDRTVERGYSGASIWNWHTLPTYIDKRYTDYARANASIGINGTVLTNVNANALVLTPAYLQKVKALADVFRVYGIKVYLTARFSA
ncbi:MAG: alpha-glucuronidase, partial [Chitinophagaceae bacterium]